MFRKFSAEVMRRTLPIALIAAAIAVILSILFTLVTGGRYAWWNKADAEESGTPPEAAASAQPGAPAAPFGGAAVPPNVGATGCFAAKGNRAEQLLTTQEKVALDGIGAAEFGGAWVRWVMTYPIQDKDNVLSHTTRDPSTIGPAAIGSFPPRTATLDGALYRAAVMGDDAYVDVALEWHDDNNSSQVNSARTSLHLVQRNGTWVVAGAQAPKVPAEQFEIGMTPYTDGC